jgi:hypothetical protein
MSDQPDKFDGGISATINVTRPGDIILRHIMLVNGSGRYMRVHVENYGEIPANKPGTGHKAWLFIDELIVE